MSTSPHEPKGQWLDRVVAAWLGFVYITVLVKTTSTLGYARDEGFYFQAAGSYGRWFEQLAQNRAAAMEPRAVDAAWSLNHEHPGLIKGLFALSNLFLEKKHHLFAMEGTSYRFPAMVLAGLAIGVVYLWGAQARSRIAGLGAAVLLAAMPRFFYQSHLACFDIPIVAMWTVTAYAYWRARRDGGWGWPVAAGVLFGLALDTKHNSWFLPICFVTHAVAMEAWRWIAPRLGTVNALASLTYSRVRLRGLGALGAMATLGPVVFYALWPWIWHDTARRLGDYAGFHLNHEYYNMEFLGANYWKAPMPRLYAWVMTAATVPVVTLALFAVGLLVAAWPLLVAVRSRSWGEGEPERTRDRSFGVGTEILWLGGLTINYVAWLRMSTPIFGGTKHWMTAYPFLALFAGVGLDAAVKAARLELFRLRARASWMRGAARSPWAVASLAAALAFAAPIWETLRSHPWGLSYYTPLVGGPAGGASLGLNRGFWGYQTGAVADFLNREAPRNASVYIHDTAWQSWEMLQRDGRIRKDLRASASIAGADFGLYHHEKHMLGQEYQNWIAFGTDRPAFIGGIDGVPVILVYKRPGLPTAPP